MGGGLLLRILILFIGFVLICLLVYVGMKKISIISWCWYDMVVGLFIELFFLENDIDYVYFI